MNDNQGTCIYCGSPVPPWQGEGDHVIPAALGRFEGEFIFQRICPRCNSLLGECEEQLLRCAPEAFVRRLVQPPVKRNRRGRGWSGAHGMPRPKFTIKHADHHELVEASATDPATTYAVDQLVVVDKDNVEHHIRLFPDMTVAGLRAKIDALPVKQSGNCFLHADEAACPKYAALLKEIWPHFSLTQRDIVEPGVHTVAGRAMFEFHADYWRAIAKIGFHYYLLNTCRGVRGDEPVFAGIRQFIIRGGDHEPFFTDAAAQFGLPFGELPDGGAILPGHWAHILAADESHHAAVAMVSLFMGPIRLAPTRHIRLGRFHSPLIVPGAQCAHAYLYDAQSHQKKYAGRVATLTLTQLR